MEAENVSGAVTVRNVAHVEDGGSILGDAAHLPQLYLLALHAFGTWTDPGRELAARLRGLGVDELTTQRIAGEALTPYEAARALLGRLPHGTLTALVAELRRAIDVPADAVEGMALMDWDMLATMRAAGHTIGSHTRTHTFLVNEPLSVMRDELRGSKQEIESRLGMRVEHLAYPNGDFDPIVAAAAREAGYRYAYTVCSCRDDTAPELTIPRHMMWERSGVGLADRFSPMLFECETRGVFDSLMGCGRLHARG